MKIKYKVYEKVLMELGNFMDQIVMSSDNNGKREAIRKAIEASNIGSLRYNAGLINYIIKNWETDWKKCATLIIVWRVTNYKREDLLMEISPTVKVFFEKKIRVPDILRLLGYS